MTPLHIHYRLQALQFFCSDAPIKHGTNSEMFTALLALPEHRVLREIRRALEHDVHDLSAIPARPAI